MTALSITTRGNEEEKLRWVFSLYDADCDGFVTRLVKDFKNDDGINFRIYTYTEHIDAVLAHSLSFLSV